MLAQQIFDWQAGIAPEREAVRDTRGTVWSRADLRARSNRFANALVASGMAKGDRIAVLAKNCPDFLAFYLGAAKAGVVVVPLNFRLAPPEWAYIGGDAGVRLAIARGDLVDGVEAVRDQLPSVEVYVSMDVDARDGWVDLEAWLGDAPGDSPPPIAQDADDAAIQMYTSGTTGLPKGVLLTNGSIATHLQQVAHCYVSTAGLRMQLIAPFCHVASAIGGMVALALDGSLFIHEEFVPDEVVRVLDEADIGHTILVPAMIQFLLASVPDVADRKYESLRLISYGTAPIGEDTLRRAIDVFACEFSQGFGQTEATGMLTFLSPRDHRRATSGEKPELLRSCGRPILATELKIVDGGGAELAPHEVGEIVARGPQLMKGYWKRPDATDAVLRDGWLHTGDAGYLDDEGYLYICDRIKDMIVSGGENVYPAEIEQVLLKHPGVADAAVIGIPDDKWGEVAHAVVVAQAGEAVDEAAILEFCGARLGGFKRPRSVVFVDAIPRNASMKILKKDLRAPYWEGRTRNVN